MTQQMPEPMEEYEDWDPSELTGQVADTLRELGEMRAAMAELRGNHDQLHDSFRTHHIAKAHNLNFV